MIYLFCGYGLPKDIRADQNYVTYLHVAFNAIYERSRGASALLIPSGGPTACTPPFEGTEAEAMTEYLQKLMDRPVVSAVTRGWRIVPEKESLSTLENFVFAKRIIDEQGVDDRIVVFGEKMAEERRREIADLVFGAGRCEIVSIDFDVSKNRYLDPKLIAEKEKCAIEEARWTLADPARLSQHHEAFKKKFEFLRDLEAKGMSHVDAIEEWYKRASQHKNAKTGSGLYFSLWQESDR